LELPTRSGYSLRCLELPDNQQNATPLVALRNCLAPVGLAGAKVYQVDMGQQCTHLVVGSVELPERPLEELQVEWSRWREV